MPRPNFSETVLFEMASFFCADDQLIGQGSSRKVYGVPVFPNLVIKIEDTQRSFQNVQEYEVWQEARDSEWSKWFAPAVAISHSGSILLQRRTTPIERLPLKLPSFMDDIGLRQMGRMDGRVVVHDYGWTKFIRSGLRQSMMKGVKDRLKP